MQVVYYKGSGSKTGLIHNFGDQLNCWLWNEMLPAGHWNPADGICFLGIGTVIDQSIIGASLLVTRKFIVFGSGAGYGVVPKQFGSASWKIVSVRGPLSAHVLGLDPIYATTDGAILLASLDRFKPSPLASNEVVFMPHHESETDGHWSDVCAAAGFTYLSPMMDSRAAVDTIRSARLVLADSMHAAIVADTFRVPWIPLSTSSHINTFKWLDWTLGLNLPYAPIVLPPSSSLEALREHTLSFCGECFRVNPPTAEEAIKDFALKQKLRSSRSWKFYGNSGSKMVIGAPRRLYNGKPFAMLRAKDKTFVERAAQALFEASKQTQYLSHDQIMHERLDQMLEGIEKIPHIVQDWSNHTPSPSSIRLSPTLS